MIKGAEKVARASKKIVQSNIRTWITIYYDFSTETVMTEADYYKNNKIGVGGAYKVCQLIRENTADEIRGAVKQWMHC